MFTLEIFIHVDAVGRGDWTGAPDERPLTDVGRKQAARMAQILTVDPIDALVSSPALRCRESLEPLAATTGLDIEVVPGFRDTLGYRAPDGWGKEGPDPLGGAFSAGSAYAALSELRERYAGGRVVLCSYGDIVPALLAFLSGLSGAAMPARNNDKGAVFTVSLDGGTATMTTHEAPADFPQ